ncbi:hypothetical protein Pen02_79460 [Plantactinospora endophytica]|uniref:Uncharacterized protein n=2 Tax=Plantactinospora endophytica TaxID=673535 RepID=A0ABQ4EE48_9ACTN|nr:hypothetical protein Pen02_79460 [Plantactinospora endophytica]
MYRPATLALVTLAATGTVAFPVQADGPGDTLYGDYNADGIQDAAVLGSVAPNLCSTIVEFGGAPGVYLPPIAYTYLTPNGGSTPRCPDIGTAVNVDGDPADELWIGWSAGPPSTLDYNQLVLQPPTFAPAATYRSSLATPAFIGKGRFSAGGRYSPYAIGPGGMAQYLIEGSTVALGPVRFCSVDTPEVRFADWTEDGVDGTLLSYTNRCEDGSSGVVRIRRSGVMSQLELDPTNRTRWTARAVNANGDRYPDARTVNQTTGEVSYFVNTRVGGDFLLVRAPDANTDRVALTSARALTIDVLANDYVTRYATVTVTDPPRYGTTRILTDRRILYQPDPIHGRIDRFSYQVNEEGKRSTATVTIRLPE